jgi:hypothetical protein
MKFDELFDQRQTKTCSIVLIVKRWDGARVTTTKLRRRDLLVSRIIAGQTCKVRLVSRLFESFHQIQKRLGI